MDKFQGCTPRQCNNATSTLPSLKHLATCVISQQCRKRILEKVNIDFSPTDRDLKNLLGEEVNSLLGHYSDELEQIRECVRINLLLEAGIIPATFRCFGTCENCGEVPLENPSAVPLVGCPWCHTFVGKTKALQVKIDEDNKYGVMRNLFPDAFTTEGEYIPKGDKK